MTRRRRTAGLSALEVVVSAALGSIVLGGGIVVTSSSSEVARSSATEDAASRHVARVLRLTCDEIRRASLGTVTLPDGSPLASGASASGFRSRRVLGFSGAVVLDTVAAIRFVQEPGAATGDIVRTQSGVDETIARGVTSFSIARNLDSFTVNVAARSGSMDDRGRGAHGTMTVVVRNP